MKFNIKPATISRIIALLVALANQCLALFGQNILPFTVNTAYLVVSFVVTIIVVVINAWYNNDFTKAAILSSMVFEALKDGKITEEEIRATLDAVSAEDHSDKAKK